MTVTVAPGMIAPLGSVTVPEIVADLICAKTAPAINRHKAIVAATVAVVLDNAGFMLDMLFSVLVSGNEACAVTFNGINQFTPRRKRKQAILLSSFSLSLRGFA
jgi:hypothetical protein